MTRDSVPDGPGAVIREARLARGLTLRQLAAQVDSTASYLCEIEGGKYHGLGLLLAVRVAKALRIPLKRLADAVLAAGATGTRAGGTEL